MSGTDQFTYQGPEREYKPALGSDYTIDRVSTIKAEIPTNGYQDLDYLHKLLNSIAASTGATASAASRILSDYSVKIDASQVELKQCHDSVYPDDDTPEYITFDEYKYLLTGGDSHAVQLLKHYYEAKLRGPKGTAALDYYNLARAIYAEVERIRHFLTTYIGELDETAEFRTVELFQDWAEDTAQIAKALQNAVTTQVSTRLAQSELDQLDHAESAKYQMVFQTKLNAINKTIKDEMGRLEKNWHNPSNDFYNKVLGPALLFQIKVANALSNPNHIGKNLPLLSQEASGAIAGLSANYTVALHDQLQRNKTFQQIVLGIAQNVERRDIYKNYVRQLEPKGKILDSPFVSSSTVSQADPVLNAPNPLDGVTNPTNSSTAFRPSHNDLLDRFTDDAHPQYFLVSGGTIEGDVELAEGVRIDGIIPSKHKHDGTDGSEKISGSNIIPGTIIPDNIDSSATTSVPENLAVINQTALFDASGVPRFATEVVFSVDETTNIVGYEFEVTRLT